MSCVWSDAESLKLPSPRWMLIIVIVSLIGVMAWEWHRRQSTKPHVKVTPKSTTKRLEFGPIDRILDLTVAALAETRGIYVGWTAIRRERVHNLRKRYLRERRISDLMAEQEQWDMTAHLGDGPIVIAAKLALSGDPAIKECHPCSYALK